MCPRFVGLSEEGYHQRENGGESDNRPDGCPGVEPMLLDDRFIHLADTPIQPIESQFDTVEPLLQPGDVAFGGDLVASIGG